MALRYYPVPRAAIYSLLLLETLLLSLPLPMQTAYLQIEQDRRQQQEIVSWKIPARGLIPPTGASRLLP